MSRVTAYSGKQAFRNGYSSKGSLFIGEIKIFFMQVQAYTLPAGQESFDC
jgi:hypothetical protein